MTAPRPQKLKRIADWSNVRALLQQELWKAHQKIVQELVLEVIDLNQESDLRQEEAPFSLFDFSGEAHQTRKLKWTIFKVTTPQCKGISRLS